MGNFDGSPMQKVSGVSGAAPVMHSVMRHMHQRFGTTWYERPENIKVATVDPLSGLRRPGRKKEWFIDGSIPPMETIKTRDGNGRVYLRREFAMWWKGPQNHLRAKTVLSESVPEVIRVISPQPGTVVYLDPDLPATSRQLPLRVNSDSVSWQSQTLRCLKTSMGFMAQLKPGRHELIAMVEGRRLCTWVKVVEE